MFNILLFNPSHEIALAANSQHYTPPKHIQLMETDLCMLPLLWAKEDDYILTPEGLVDIKGKEHSFDTSMIPKPWGWNRSVRYRFLRLGVDESLMPSEFELDEWRKYSSRRWAATYNAELYNKVHQLYQRELLVDNHIQFCSTSKDFNEWLAANSSNPYILKSEYSSSGRGNRINCSVSSTQCLSLADRFYNKVLDFAMEFEATNDKICYLGLSVFEASREGRYAFNYLRSQSELREMILNLLPEGGEYALDSLADIHKELLSTHLQGHYRGFIGIDMMIVEDGKIHPCVEINLRMNMGVLAMMLQEHNVTQIDVSKYVGKMFCPIIKENRFYIK